MVRKMGGEAQQIAAHNGPYSSFSLFFCPLCIRRGFDKKFAHAVQDSNNMLSVDMIDVWLMAEEVQRRLLEVYLATSSR
jgi:hypothetical protein